MTLWEHLYEHMMNHPDKTLQENKATITYEEIAIYAKILAKSISGQSSCAIYCHSELAAAMALLGCFAAGVTAIPLSPRYGKAHCQKILQWINPSCVLTDLEGELGVYYIKDSMYISPPENPALILCTSGTTGTPKGVMLSDKNILCNISDITQYFRVGSSDSILIARPLYHGAVLTGEFLFALTKGLNITFYSGAFNPIEIIKQLKRSQATIFGTTPTLARTTFRLLKDTTEIAIKHLVISGECLTATTAKDIRAALPNTNIYYVYGLTEASPRVSYLPPEHFDSHPGSAGYPLQSVKLQVRDQHRKPVTQGTEGVLWVKGGNVMLGYYNNPTLTKRVLVNGWLCTGDIAKIDTNGFLYLFGRSDNMIIRAGMNIYPQEIEEELKKDPRTEEVLVYGVNDPKCGTQIAMKIVGQFSTEQEVRTLCIKVLPAYQVPTQIELVEKLPKNGTGKLIRGNHYD